MVAPKTSETLRQIKIIITDVNPNPRKQATLLLAEPRVLPCIAWHCRCAWGTSYRFQVACMYIITKSSGGKDFYRLSVGVHSWQ